MSRNFRTLGNDTFIDKRRSKFIDSKLDVQEDNKEKEMEDRNYKKWCKKIMCEIYLDN